MVDLQGARLFAPVLGFASSSAVAGAQSDQAVAVVWPSLAFQRPLADGIEADSLESLYRASEWSELTTDEMIRFHPRLSGDRAGVVSAHLSDAWCVLQWSNSSRARHPDEASPASVRRGFALACHWYAGPRWAAVDDADLIARSQSTIRILRACLDGGPDQVRLSRDEALAFAYFVGVHPANLWPQFGAGAAELAAAAWLGWLDRGRSAYMLPEVADALLGSTGAPARNGRPIGAEVAFGSRAPSARLRRAAARVSRGEAALIRPARQLIAAKAMRGLVAALAGALP